ncbi:hypothetical protein AB870_24465 (plasmid) [Pandoraea faecigallinarum]|uniref:Uncharacterized protein n=1 Tax=Pandoraea faecigallinarum TaxID=656179 RepID=A0A0H3X3J8_9BURK|nr:hypothetical protein AB870_24465 [Pandoraea faecigallinarum]
MPAPHLDALAPQQTSQHARSRERELKMQLVDTTHQAAIPDIADPTVIIAIHGWQCVNYGLQ